ncbi:hypothetical protein NC651_005823 [Populus alba x Populus x berolinensis]|nr:hypothetical protein NC651_005823 [Populus alba x Populus x berolinensis]
MGYRQVVGENDSREDTTAIMSAMNTSRLCQALSEDVVIVCCLYTLSGKTTTGDAQVWSPPLGSVILF